MAAVGPELRINPGAMVASMLYYWVPDQQCSIEGVRKLPPGSWARILPGREAVRPALLADRGRGGRSRGRPGPEPADLREVIQESVARAHGGRRAGVELPVRRPGLEHHHRAGSSGQPGRRRLHHHLPAGRPAARGHARRRGLRPEGRRASSASTCTRSRSRRTSSSLLPRMVDTLDEPIGDPAAINTLLMCEAARERGVKVILSGMGADELFGGYRKQLACLMASRYSALPGLAPGRRAVRRGPAAGQRGRPRPALRALGQALPDLRRPAGGAEVPAQLHAVRPG